MKMMSSGCKSPKLKHAVSFRRRVYMILRAGIDELNLAMRFKIYGFDCTIYARSDEMLRMWSGVVTLCATVRIK